MCPCDTCIVDLLPSNVEILRIYDAVRSQMIISPDGEIIDLNYSAVKDVIDLFEVEDPYNVFGVIRYCFDIEKSISKEL